MSELFDRYERSYGEVVQSSIDFSGLPHDFFMQAKAAVLAELIGARRWERGKPETLDVGCGVGTFHPLLRGLTSRLCGIDVSTASVARARADNPAVAYADFDGRTFPHESATFDLAIATCVLHHIPPGEWSGFMREMRRVVRPGGAVCVMEHNPLNPLTRLAVARCEFDRDAVLLRAGTAKTLMAEAGLHEIGSRYFLFLPWASSLARRVEFRLRQVPLGAQYAVWGTV